MTVETMNDHLVGVQGDLITMMIPVTGADDPRQGASAGCVAAAVRGPGGERFAEIRDACANT